MTSLRFAVRMLGKVGYAARGLALSMPPAKGGTASPSRLRDIAQASQRGVWKWDHYFEIYERHFSKFVGASPTVLEIGVLNGGSLDMWRNYFGTSQIIGVDINQECLKYTDHRIVIGDQGDRSFWRNLNLSVDVLIDDGSHRPEDQIATLEEMLPRLNPGGVYLCEDIHGVHNGFCEYVHGMIKSLNAMQENPSATQQWLSVHSYPFVTVIEKSLHPISKLHAPKFGVKS